MWHKLDHPNVTKVSFYVSNLSLLSAFCFFILIEIRWLVLMNGSLTLSLLEDGLN